LISLGCRSVNAVSMYLRVDGTTLTQQRTLALHVVALRKGVAGDTMKIVQ